MKNARGVDGISDHGRPAKIQDTIGLSKQDAAALFIRWLSHSGILDSDPESPCFGGYFNFYDAKRGVYPMIYLEITGYAVQFWLRLYGLSNKRHYLDLACKSGDFLVKSVCYKARNSHMGAFPYGFLMPGARRIERYFAFDNAVCISALIDLFQATSNTLYARAADEAGQWLKGLQRSNGSFTALKDMSPRDSGDLPRIQNWFGDSSSLGSKNAVALLKLHRMSGEKDFFERAEKLLGWVLQQQNNDGSFRVSADSNFTFTHAHCYVLEALLYSAEYLQREDLLQAAERGGHWLGKVQNRDGSLYRFYGTELKAYFRHIPRRQKLVNRLFIPRDTGPTAQAARIWGILQEMTGDDRFFQTARSALTCLIECQRRTLKGYNTQGGLPASTIKALGRYWDSPVYSPWEAMFACQALMIFAERSGEGKHANPEDIF